MLNYLFYPFYDDCNNDGGFYKTSPIAKATNQQFDVFLYPNTNKGQYYIQCNTPTNEVLNVKVTDMQGKIVMKLVVDKINYNYPLKKMVNHIFFKR